MSEKLSLTVKSDRDQLGEVIEAIEGMAEREEWDPGFSYRVHLALEELVLNVMDYGYDDKFQDIEIHVTSDSDAITIEIVDSGRPFDPLSEAPEPDLEAAVEERRIGGLGVHLVKTLMDRMDYRRENEQNRLTIMARRTPE